MHNISKYYDRTGHSVLPFRHYRAHYKVITHPLPNSHVWLMVGKSTGSFEFSFGFWQLIYSLRRKWDSLKHILLTSSEKHVCYCCVLLCVPTEGRGCSIRTYCKAAYPAGVNPPDGCPHALQQANNTHIPGMHIQKITKELIISNAFSQYSTTVIKCSSVTSVHLRLGIDSCCIMASPTLSNQFP